MTTETEIQDVQENQGVELSDFGIQPNRREGFTTLTKDDATLKIVAASSNVTVEGPRGVQVKRSERKIPNTSNIIYSGKNDQILTTNGATVSAPVDGPASATTPGDVFLVDPNAPEAIAPAEGTEPKTGTQLNIVDGHLTGRIDGTKVDMNGENVTIDAPLVQVKPADEATTDAEKDVEFSLSDTFNSLVVKGAHVDVRIEIEDGHTNIYVNGSLEVTSAEDANVDVNGDLVNVNGDVTRFTLAGGKVFDINTATGEVIAYTARNEKVHNVSDAELAEMAPANETYKVTMSQDGTRVAMNGSSVEKTDGVFAAATDGVSQLTAVAEAYASSLAAAAAQAEAERAQREAADIEARNAPPEGFVAIVWPDGTPVLSPTTHKPMFVAEKDLDGTQTLEQANAAVADLQSQGVTNAHLAFVEEDNILCALFNQLALSRPKDGMSDDEIVSAHTKGEVPSDVPTTKKPVNGFRRPGGIFGKRATKAAGHYWTGDQPTPENPIPYDINGAIIYRGDGQGIKGEKNPNNKHSTRIVC